MSAIITIEFLVKAKKWEDVVKIFKNELGVDKGKRDTSVRDINGLFFVSVGIDGKELTEEFYKKVKKSSKISIIKNPGDKKLRNDILEEVYKVETHLRKLLLYISDTTENFYQLFKNTYADKVKSYIKKKGKESTIVSGEIDPISSYLTLENTISILSKDISWNNHNIYANDILQILEKGDNINDYKKFLKQKMKKNTIWNEISKTLLEQTISWDNVSKDFNKLRALRNRAAHFNVLTEKDLKDTRELTEKILGITKTKSNVTNEQIVALQKATYINNNEMFLSVTNRLSEAHRQLSKVSRQAATFIRFAQTEQVKETIKAIELISSLTPGVISETSSKKSDNEKKPSK